MKNKLMMMTFIVGALLLLGTKVKADTNSLDLSVEGGYNNNYVVNGVAYSQDLPYASVAAVKSLKYGDVYVGGTLLADGDSDQSHWLFGVGSDFYTLNQFTLRADAGVIRHQTSSVGLNNSTETFVKLSVKNPWVTPYIRGAFNFELHQNAYFVGAERVQSLPYGFVITPAVEWGKSTSYETFNVKASLSRSVSFAWGTVTPFVDVGWYNNNVYEAASTAYSLVRFDNDVVYNAGIRLSF
jgi:hypothetical protein